MRAKLKSVRAEMRRRMHLPIPDQGRWLASVLAGHYRYYAVPTTSTRWVRLATRSRGPGCDRFGVAVTDRG
jgi:hypothetical protein